MTPSAKTTRRRTVRAVTIADIEDKDLDWLWYPYIPFGNVAMLFGRGGLGKSTVCAQLSGALTRGLPLPGQDRPHRPMTVLYLSAEDDPAAVMKPRFLAAGADLSRIVVPSQFFTLERESFWELEALIDETGARVVFIDPVTAWIGGRVDINRANEVRSFMAPLKEICDRTNSAIVLLHHIRKDSEANGGYAGDFAMGSADFTNAVRSSLYVREAGPRQRVIQHVKSNWGPHGPNLAFTFEGDGDFQWRGVIEDPEFFKKNTPRTAARQFLLDLLKDGPITARSVEVAAAEKGLVWRTVTRAKVTVADSYASRKGGKLCWFWRLKGDTRRSSEEDEVGAKGASASASAGATPPPPRDRGNDEPLSTVPSPTTRRRAAAALDLDVILKALEGEGESVGASASKGRE